MDRLKPQVLINWLVIDSVTSLHHQNHHNNIMPCQKRRNYLNGFIAKTTKEKVVKHKLPGRHWSI